MKQFVIAATALVLTVIIAVFLYLTITGGYAVYPERKHYGTSTEILGSRFESPDTYELLYKTTLDNGLSITR